MAIDECTHTFEELSSQVLATKFGLLQTALQRPFDATILKDQKSATKVALEALNVECDFSGCYVFVEDSKPRYVGISRSVVKRLTQHLNHESHYAASLVYKMASEEFPHEFKRDQAMKDGEFKKVFLQSQSKLRKMKFAFVEIKNDLELYLFEVYAAIKLDTSSWNTFRTH